MQGQAAAASRDVWSSREIYEQGKEAVVAIFGLGDFFGEGSLNGHALRVATTSAMAECVVISMAPNVR
jgi:CRP-like cAMP-binding protein